MDILRKELNQIYQSQLLGQEILDPTNIVLWKEKIASLATTGDEMDVITDASADRCHIFPAKLHIFSGFPTCLTILRPMNQATKMQFIPEYIPRISSTNACLNMSFSNSSIR